MLEALRQITRASRQKELLDIASRRKIFQATLQWEQEKTVAPKVKEEIARFDCPILKRLVLKPFVRFSYFPRFKMFWFRNFSETEERIRNACESFEIAEKVGWNQVFTSMKKYEVLDENFFQNPLEFARNLKKKLLPQVI